MNGCAHILNQWSPAWWEYTLHATWQAALTTAILLGVAALGRKWPAPWRYGLLLLALFKFAFPPFLSAPSGAFSQLGPQLVSSALARPQSQSLLAATPGPVQARAAPGRPGAEAEMTSQPDSGRFAAQAASAHSSRGFARGAGLHWTAWLMLLHFAGCAAMFLWIARQLSRLRQAVRGSRVVTEGPLPLMLNTLAAALRMKRIPALRISNRVTAPVAFGVLHPTILMPATNLSRLSGQELKVILAHELAHFRRSDLWVNWAQILLQAIWWFNPLLWLLNTALRKVREDCCDDLLLARKLTSSDLYCDTLLRAAVEFGRPEPLGGALGFGERLHPLGRRLARIMDAGVPRAHRLSALGSVVVLGMGFLLLPGLRSQPASFGQQSTASKQPPATATALNPSGSTPAPAPATNAASLERLFAELKLDFTHQSGGQERLRREFKGHGPKAVALLTNELARATSSDQRQKAAWLLGQLDSPVPQEAIQALIRALEDGDKDAGRWAAMALRDIGPPASQAVPALMEALRFQNAAAGQALARIAPDSEPVATLLVESFEEACKLAATEPPGTLGQRIAEGLADQMTFAFVEVNTNRLEIERALVSAYGSGEASLQRDIGFALQRLKPQTPEGRETVGAWLAALRKEGQGRWSLPQGGVEELIERIKSPTNQREANEACNTLAAIAIHGDTNAARAVPALIEYARNPASQYRQSAVNALGNIGLAASNAVPLLMSCLGDDDHGVQGNSIHALGRIGPRAKRAVPAIRALLTGGPNRFLAANALWRIDSEYVPLALSVFIEMLNQRSLRGDILALALDEMGPQAKQALPALARLLDEQDPQVRLAAAKAFWHVDPGHVSRAVPALGILSEELFSQRVGAIKLLGEIGPGAKAALPHLQTCLKDEDEEVRAAAAQAVRAISGAAAGS